MRIEVFLDDERAPRASFEPPGQLELDTSDLADGPHVLRVRASGGEGSAGNEEIPFVVRNGPGIAVVGLRKQEVVRGRVPILVNAYESRRGDVFEPGRVETPAPIPTWTWVLALVVMTWAMWYAASEYRSHADTLAAAAPGAAAPASAPASPPSSTSAPSGASAAEPAWKAQGAQVFGNYCSPCHQLTGQGLPGVFPPARAVASRGAICTWTAWSSGGLSTIKGHSARRVRACAGLLKGGTSGSSIVGFRFRVILGIRGRSRIPGSSWTSSPTSSATRQLDRLDAQLPIKAKEVNLE